MNRIQKTFSNSSEKIISYITAGFPKIDSTVPLALACIESGIDLLEIGLPFSDPIADGPIIQESNQIALKNGINLNLILQQIKNIRQRSNIPIILMGYINPIMHYGEKKFLRDCLMAGVDGLIIPDLPPEESKTLLKLSKESGISLVYLVSPNTPNKRIKQIAHISPNLIYCVSILGITGTKTAKIKNLRGFIKRVKSITNIPLIVGFGIKTREDVKNINKFADGAVIGSELIRSIMQGKNPINNCRFFLKTLKA